MNSYPQNSQFQSLSRRERIPISPRARRALLRRGLEFSALKNARGSGPRGRFIEADVLNFEPQVQPQTFAPPVSNSIQTNVIHLKKEIDASALLAMHARLLSSAQAMGKTDFSLTDWMLRAMVFALREVPQANRIRNGDEFEVPSTIDIGLTVECGEKTTTAMIRDARRMNVIELARCRRELVKTARAGELPSELLTGGAISLCNAGRKAIDEIIVSPAPLHSSVLCAGHITPRPFIFDGELCVRPTLRLCFCADAAVLSGQIAAGFLEHVSGVLQEPELLIFS